MFGYTPLASSPTATNPVANIVPDPEPVTGLIDASKVPADRRVVFEGSKRVVSFPGSIHKVEF